ncbi:MAG: ATP-dependent RecD-like DNA helicase [Syntrophorhabdaceae bacterium]|nr:ATP-dependent RecD-like DNA helicase [Syntrophorhabdaceae bacterium]
MERVTYYNEENHYTIAKVKVEGRNSLATVVGTLYSVVPGEVLRLKGNWEVHPRWGEQFKVISYETLMPATVKGIERYLGSGMIKGIGPVMAKRLVTRFREATLDIIDTDMDKILDVPGIGRKRVDMIRKAWEEQKEVRNVMVFLQGNGVSPAYAAKIYRFYGGDAVRIVSENPYRLAVDIFGIGFLTADSIAGKLGIGKEAPLRIETGILYVLGQLSSEGHIFFPCSLLVDKCSEVLEVEGGKISDALSRLAAQGKVIIDDPGAFPGMTANYTGGIVYLAPLYVSERGIAELLSKLATVPRQLRLLNVGEALRWVEGNQEVTFSERQLDAVRASLEQKVLVITGGPGTGKTTIIKGIIGIAGKTGQKVLLAAPTGRAAKRMTEATGAEAKTIHRLLEYAPSNASSDGGFKRNESNPLDAGLIVIDEASMVDVPLMYHLLKAVPPTASLVLVGDVDQLPSVGPGSVLNDIIASGCVGTVRLAEIFRQSTRSMIIVNAHRINGGEMPFLEKHAGQGHDFFFVDIEDPDEVLRYVVDLCKDMIPSRFGFHPSNDIQVLTPMHRGVVGVSNMNVRLQETLNRSTDGISRGGRFFKRGDKVLQTRNNYEKDVYNGDIGRVIAIDREVQELSVEFDGKVVSYDFNDLDELILAYAISVHKSQGSEYPVVVMPLLTQHYLLLQRNLLYTAITRGKKLVYLIGTKKALSIAIHNDRPRRRYTLLAERLREAMQKKNNQRKDSRQSTD